MTGLTKAVLAIFIINALACSAWYVHDLKERIAAVKSKHDDQIDLHWQVIKKADELFGEQSAKIKELEEKLEAAMRKASDAEDEAGAAMLKASNAGKDIEGIMTELGLSRRMGAHGLIYRPR